jgi:hypothetical protein
MKKSLTVEEFIEEYTRLSVLQGEFMLSLDNYKKHNKNVNKQNRLMKKYFVDKDYEFKVLNVAINNKDDFVRSSAAAAALRDGITELTDKAILVLEEVAKRPDLIGGGAEMALRIYRAEIEGKTLW